VKRQHRDVVRVLAVVMASAALAWAVPAGAHASTRPYRDSGAIGSITLCGRNGAQLTSGSVSAKPFAWRAVDTTPSPAGYRTGGTATLYAFQPRLGVDPGDWSGEQLTASSHYSSIAHPTAAATYADGTLASFLGDYPARWNGYVELRMYLGAPGQVPSTVSYDAADLQVSGGTWRLLDGGPNDCAAAGHAISLETATLPVKELRQAKKAAQDVAEHPAATARSGTPGGHSSAPSTPAGASTVSGSALARSGSGTSHSGRTVTAITALALLVAAGGALALRRRS
jgi:hypothetical protein